MYDMTKDKVLNLRVEERQRAAYERAAALEGVTVSRLVTSAADARAEEILHDASSMVLPSQVFDQMLEALDRPTALAPSLDRAFTERQFENR
jgi:uncharacterized protein (DUF1778 family)